LIEKNSLVTAMEFSRCARTGPQTEQPAHWAGLSKLNSVRRGRRYF
jgi:hypothetical protein